MANIDYKYKASNKWEAPNDNNMTYKEDKDDRKALYPFLSIGLSQGKPKGFPLDGELRPMILKFRNS